MQPLDRDKLLESLSYEPSRHIDDFHLAGFAYYDGLDVIQELTLGQSVDLVKEDGNPYDEQAVAIYYQDRKLGYYIPASHNAMISTLLYYGHGDIFEARIQMVDHESHPKRQFRVVVKVKDARQK